MRCLVIDDCSEDRSLVERMLQKCGHRAMCVPSGMDALAVLGEHRFDVALVDLDMPGMNGAETICALRAMDLDMRVLVVSGREDRRHVLEALDAGADGYLLKDELADRLTQAIQEVFAGKSPLSAGVAAILLRQMTGRLPPRDNKRLPGKMADASGELIVGGVTLLKKEVSSGD